MSLEPTTDGQSADDYQAAIAQGFMPIRDVARITGVNAVTLRAWERRYGLIVPHRTPKGHRLYSDEHVAHIQAILTWLNRGVSVSQVKGLLRSNQPAFAEASSQWETKRQQLQEAICNLSERRLDDCFNRELALYPPNTLCEQLLLPLLEELELRWRNQFGAQAERVFFYSWLRSKLGARLYHNNRQHNGAPLLLINVSDLPMAAGMWLTAWLASNAGVAVEVFDWPLPPPELALAVEHIQPRALLLYSSQALNSTHLQRLLGGYDCPCLLVGQVVQIHADELKVIAQQNPELSLAVDPLAALHCLTDLNLLHS
ncbi:MerR family transcriptional regulator [Pseudomonas leptonychotis]|uniref:MerR family transcriptional regulator n=1 Tax=Pseudomonas leptonychotis TaxID=2448482 RepID=A0A4T1ZW97_9PSED|nr:MerR family transcriptional regulator [Pseudomonas leptonychotis]TIH07041.1 MerR family transcriptional regulator [Pseudomonas leptonychotis]